jgi:triacylglycerol lipase
MNLVFASGFLIPQKYRHFEYFRGLPRLYPAALFPRVDLTAGVEERSWQLATQIARTFPSGPIHIVAHSVGGLDARFLISHNLEGLAPRVATLSTVSTPHRGTPLADLLIGPVPHGPQRMVYEIVRDAMARLGYAVGGLASLSTEAAARFNRDCPDAPEVKYFAYAGCGPRSYSLRPGAWLIEKMAGTADQRENDGLVSVASAQWPSTQLAEPAWAADHLAQVGYDLDRPGAKPQFDYLAAISRVVDRALSAPDLGETRGLARGAP